MNGSVLANDMDIVIPCIRLVAQCDGVEYYLRMCQRDFLDDLFGLVAASVRKNMNWNMDVYAADQQTVQCRFDFVLFIVREDSDGNRIFHVLVSVRLSPPRFILWSASSAGMEALLEAKKTFRDRAGLIFCSCPRRSIAMAMTAR